MSQIGFPNLLNDLDFTLNKYERLCDEIVKSKYIPITVAGYLQLADHKNNSYIIIRHDVDRTPQRARDIAQVEQKYGIQATYYFRAKRGTFSPTIIDKIVSYGHEIGYHYETIDKCRGNMKMAEKLFAKELASFRERCVITTVCAHGNPLTHYDNKEIWKNLKLENFQLRGEAFLSLDYNKCAYFSDSGRTWLNNKSQKMPGKDSVKTAFDYIEARNTNDLIGIIKEGNLPNICVLTHPERWSKDILGFTNRFFVDTAFSCGKDVIYIFRRGSNQ